MANINIFMDVEDSLSMSAFYRSFRPFAMLRRLGLQVNLQFWKPPVNWDVLSSVDLYFAQRPHSEASLMTMKTAKQLGIPIWVDHDDDILNIGPNIPGPHRYYSKVESRKRTIEIMEIADVVTVTTTNLKESLHAFNNDIRVIPNAFDDYLFKRKEKIDRKKQIMWRGTATHEKDLISVAPQILAIAKAYPEWNWCFMGYLPWAFADQMPQNTIYVDFIPNLNYFTYLQNEASMIHIVPLFPDKLNLSKSNISLLEGAWAGSACVVPNWPDWRLKGVVGYGNQKDFGEAIALLIEKEAQIPSLNEGTWKDIQDRFLLSEVNHQRRNIILELLDGF